MEMKQTEFEKIKKGTLLLAEPFMQDEHFSRTVILITEHNENGTLGLILNKPTIFKVNQMIGNFPHINAFMHFGGPIDPERLNFIHAYPDLIPNSFEISENIYWNGDYETLKENIMQKKILPHNILFFTGYSGWEYNQLRDEMEENSWIVCNEFQSIFRTSEFMWKEILQKMGGINKLIAEYPVSPDLN